MTVRDTPVLGEAGVVTAARWLSVEPWGDGLKRLLAASGER